MPNIAKLIKKQKELKVAELIDVIQDQEKVISRLEGIIKEKNEIIDKITEVGK